FGEDDARAVGRLLAETIFARDDEAKLERIRGEVRELIDAHPLYPEL
ncbi:MAG TPA: serine hydroxymethyltransferase, partial [Marinobacter sp.]|nr:serine hydroxymethyltransferase [Marinobacter sp.]